MPPYRTTSRRQYRRDVMGVVDDPSRANLQQLSTGRQITPGALRQNSKDVDATCGRDVRAAAPTNNLRSAFHVIVASISAMYPQAEPNNGNWGRASARASAMRSRPQ